jgi:hypothetical protein
LLAWRKVRDLAVLDFDIETIAAGFADPQWVPQKVTCIAWSWIGEEKVHVRTARDPHEGRRAMIAAFLPEYEKADMVTGHNLLRFDLPVLNSDCLRLGFPSLGPKLVQDTMKMVKSKGFKRGQDNIGHLLKLPVQKLPLSWQQWQDAYDDPTWDTIIERATSDVIGHKLMREAMLERDWLKPPVKWTP